MCGIAGIASHEPLRQRESAALGLMLDRLVHRGPDDSGEYRTDCLSMGHRRLTVIDPETGHQPLTNENQTIWAVVNGEIYNFIELRDHLAARGHTFRTASDSECIIHLYEEQEARCVESLQGMFAFALWDEPNRMLMLARDRLGVKPLYYHFDGRRLVFASELKSLLAVPGMSVEVDPTAILDFLTYSFIPSPKTILKNVHKLSPGRVLTLHDGRLAIQEYWDLHHQGQPVASDPRVGRNHVASAPRGRRARVPHPFQGWGTDAAIDETADGLWQHLKAATRPRLVADVPVGAFLSGGLDSTAVVAAMSQIASDDIVTMTCGFDEHEFDERDAAREVAAMLGSDHHDALIRPDATEIIDTLCWHFDEPFADASAIPTYYLSQLARQHVTVALSGDGGDEVMAGYRRYRFDRYEESCRRIVPRALRRRLLPPLASIWPNQPWLPRGLRGRATIRNLSLDAATAHGLSISTLDPEQAAAMLSPDLARMIGSYDPLDHVRALYAKCDAPDHLSKCQYVDIRLGLADGILTKVDRASMAHALEVRSPMLDHRFIEYAWSIPPRHRIRGAAGKYPLRRAVQKHVGERPARRTKSGFDVPLDDWFAGPLRERFFDTLLQADAPLHEWISPEAIRQTWRLHGSGRARCGATLWKLVMLDAWCRRFGHGAGEHRRPAGSDGIHTPEAVTSRRMTCTP
ncbi:MAG: asparagine synthase (glutamine-hydrolyzing) [Planctomycetota bacterium]